MVLAQKKVSAERALIMGLVHEVYPDDKLEQESRDFCRMLAGFPIEAAAAGKLAIELSADLDSDQSRQVDRLTFSSLAFCKEYNEMSDAIIKRLGGTGHRR
jgi:enoyl-CoA hydratase/carnithine racemase